MILYQFPISYYCEKVRWALEYKKIEYQAVNVTPGLHRLVIKRAAPTCLPPITVPVLLDGRLPVQGSDSILDYLDQNIKEPALGFENVEDVEKTRVIEKFLDEEVGAPLRAILYHTLLPHHKELIDMWNYQGSKRSKIWLTMVAPSLKRIVRKMYSTDSYAEHKKMLSESLDQLDRLYSKKEFLVGDRFSRVDLSFAAFLSPLAFPPDHPLPWPSNSIPETYMDFCREHHQRPSLKRMIELYRDYR